MKKAAATTFRKGEVELLYDLLHLLLRGGDTTLIVRRKAFSTLLAKVVKMKKKVSATESP